MELEEILGVIQSKSELTREYIQDAVEKKYEELGGLVTKNGAAYLVARQLGIDIPNSNGTSIKDIQPASRNVNISGRIVSISPVREFKRQDGSNGSVASMLVADKTGQTRVTLWNDQTQMLKDFTTGDAVQVVNAMAKQNNFGVEISIGKYGGLRKLDSTDMPSLERLTHKGRTAIADAQFGRMEITGTVMQVLRGNFIYSVCPMCGASIDGNCVEHGKVDPKHSMVISALVDDGTGVIRIAMFGDVAKRAGEADMESFVKMSIEGRYKIIKDKLEGNDFVFIGRVKQGMNNLEMLVDDLKSLNALEESKRLLDEAKTVVGE